MKSKSYNGQVIPINRDNVDTDLIIPKQYLKSIKKSGFGPFLFDSLRYNDTATLDSDDEREENSEFILNREPFRKGNILVSKSNFGCGSSREHAVWAIQNYGIDVVIAGRGVHASGTAPGIDTGSVVVGSGGAVIACGLVHAAFVFVANVIEIVI